MGGNTTGKTTMGDLFGSQLAGLKKDEKDEK
jgi:hypothetical protein